MEGDQLILSKYNEFKKEHSNRIPLFRHEGTGFYETFQKDARLVAKVCELHITERIATNRKGEPKVDLIMTGFPHKDLEVNLRKLLGTGHKVSIL